MEHQLGYSLKVRLRTTETFFGPGVAQLLRLVEESGSLQNAAAEMGMSYSKAWKIIRVAETALGFPLMERHVGGSGGGSSSLTERGADFVTRYEGFQQEINAAADRLFLRYFEGGERHEKN